MALGLLQEFKKFALRGNVIDLAVGIIIGGAFGRITTSLVNDILMPPLGILLGRVDFSNYYINLSGGEYESLAAAQAAGVVTINYGAFISTIINFIIVAFAVFLLIKQINRLKFSPERRDDPPDNKECPFCLASIPVQAKRCQMCTSSLEPA